MALPARRRPREVIDLTQDDDDDGASVATPLLTQPASGNNHYGRPVPANDAPPAKRVKLTHTQKSLSRFPSPLQEFAQQGIGEALRQHPLLDEEELEEEVRTHEGQAPSSIEMEHARTPKQASQQTLTCFQTFRLFRACYTGMKTIGRAQMAISP